MSPLRDLLIAPAQCAVAQTPETRERGRAPAPSLGVLAPARDLPAVAIAAGLAIARHRPAALVCLHAPAPPALPAVPARPAARRLAASLRARGLEAEARGRLAVVRLPDDPAEPATTTARALAAAGALPAVIAVARRSEDVDALLVAQDATLVALGPGTEPALAELALAGATELTPRAAAVSLAFDPLVRTLVLAGAWTPRAIRHAVEGLVR